VASDIKQNKPLLQHGWIWILKNDNETASKVSQLSYDFAKLFSQWAFFIYTKDWFESSQYNQNQCNMQKDECQ